MSVEASFVAVEKVGDAVLARVVCPTVGQREAPIVQEELVAAADAGGGRLVVDLSDVTMLTSVGLGALVTLHNHCRKSKGKLALFGLHETIVDLMKMTRLDKLFPIKKDRESALKAVS